MDQRALRFLQAGAWVALLSLQGICSPLLEEPPNFLTDGAVQGLPEDATQEQGYYLQQLFGQYGENGTLSFEGLTRLLLSLGLGKVQVVEIEHDALGHGHVSHLDILEVQENKHLHFHSALEHLHSTEHRSKAQAEGVTPRNGFSQKGHATPTPLPPALPGIHHVTKSSSGQTAEHSGKGETPFKSSHGHSSLNLLERVIALDHSVYNHLHEDCLNVSQLLVNFGLNSVSKITPAQFTLLCPALLYQIDSRVCIQHYDEVSPGMMESSLWPGLGWGFAAITLTSLPSVLALILVPLLSGDVFRFLLSFLVALAVGTLCGDALLHLWPHAQERSHGLLSLNEQPLADDAILKGLSVLGGIYLLFLIENLMGTLKKIHIKRDTAGKPSDRSPVKTEERSHVGDRPRPCGTESETLTVPEGETGILFDEVQDCAVQIRNSEEHGANSERQVAELHHHGHSHSPAGSAGIADIAWMVILGDGIHNFTDGLAIGAAFSDGISSGLSTTVAVFCHELPHELGDCAVLLQAGMPLRRVLLFNLLSAFLAYCGTVLGTLVSKSTSQVTPWIFAITAGVFLYVALVDMLPEMLQRSSSSGKRGSFIHFVLQNLGFLLGGALMLCIAIFEGQISFHMDG
ncbi:zinc transporter ZIP5 [Eublepharis macularius]|uniref:Zinc transporter ZIP5 n=1 Tax=Eublepharis macularius TaxID=481883 RepID=A0AA97J850_EUBMA|nr:zinc transporter ZIP5 [Eublepharis macularius]XP_054833456.1 zinc transporter ZIP5 [Eublepharis macularius]